jgi:glyoxylase I family protein
MSTNNQPIEAHIVATPINLKTSGVTHIGLRVSDLARARRFYTETLGFPMLLELPNLFIFAGGGTPIAIRGPEAQTREDDRFDPYRVGLDHIALACGDEAELARVAEALTQAGVENTGVKLDEALGKQYVAFKDPDRIAWELYMV